LYHTKLFRVHFYRVHPINVNTLHTWLNKDKANEEFRGSGNYESDEAKEIAKLKKDLQAHKDALNILKKTIKILGEDQ